MFNNLIKSTLLSLYLVSSTVAFPAASNGLKRLEEWLVGNQSYAPAFQFDQVQLAVVIGKRAKYVSKADDLKHVAEHALHKEPF